jgi:hypothetical protein
MIEIIIVPVLIVVGVIVSLMMNDENKGLRMGVAFAVLTGVVIFTGGYFSRRGVFGDPNSLNDKTYYHVLSVTPLDGKTTAVILRDGKGKTVPIEFFTPVVADTNGLYTVFITPGDNGDHNYSLVPIK